MEQHPLIFGEVLFDCFPDGSEVPGGAPFNVAWNLQAFHQQPYFISRVGDDSQGGRIRALMEAWSMPTDHLQLDREKPTGRVDISLRDGEPVFTILADQAYDHISLGMPPLPDLPRFLYHGSLALRSEQNRTTLATIRKQHPCPVFLDVNLRPPWWNRDDVLSMINDANWLKLNDIECRTIFPDHDDLNRCAEMMLDRFGLETVFLTLGSKGAKAFSKGKSPLAVSPADSLRVVDTVGAGDAFTSALLLGILHGWPLTVTMERAQEFASAVVCQRGAISKKREIYETLFNNWML